MPLPGELEPAARRLVVTLRVLSDQVGVGMTGLARKTPFSRASWDRYLNGRVLPAREAVVALVELAGAEPASVLAEWELASSAQAAVAGAETGNGSPGRPAAGPGLEPGAPVPAASAVMGWRGGYTAVVLAVAAVSFLAGAWLAPFTRPSSRPGPSAVELLGFGCQFARHDGRLYAGHVTTSDELVLINQDGQKVIEVQCLLKRHGYDPGRIDGQFGPHTERTVKQLQRAGHAVADGQVGAQTWALLRR
jgi:hypothetical protein